MRNSECEIRIYRQGHWPLRKPYQVMRQIKGKWHMTVMSTGNVYPMTPDQVLSHVLPVLVEGYDGKGAIEVVRLDPSFSCDNYKEEGDEYGKEYCAHYRDGAKCVASVGSCSHQGLG